MVNIYWAGGEDIDCYQVGGSFVQTNSFYYRTAYARCALSPSTTSGAYWQNWVSFTATSFWFSGRVGYGNTSFSNNPLVGLLNGSTLRLLINATSTNNTFQVIKYDTSGTGTQLGSNFTMSPSVLSGVPDKLDVFVNYNTVGTFTVYWNGVQVFTYSGDVTTNSLTSLSGFRLYPANSNNGFATAWSEVVVSDTDTRTWSLQTLAPVANGNTHNFDTGTPAASNVNEVTLTTTTLDGSTTAGQIDQYTIPSIATGTFSIIAVGVSSYMAKGATGPSKMDLGVRSGGTDYWSSDQVLSTSWNGYNNFWSTDPNTSSAWAGLPSNIGLKSVT